MTFGLFQILYNTIDNSNVVLSYTHSFTESQRSIVIVCFNYYKYIKMESYSEDFKKRFIKQIEEQVLADRSTLQELKRCFNGLEVGLLTRDQVSRDLRAMPTTSVRDLCVASNIECGDRDLEFMRKINDIHREVQCSMELKLKFLDSCY
mgnify:CR=1 FL=1